MTEVTFNVYVSGEGVRHETRKAIIKLVKQNHNLDSKKYHNPAFYYIPDENKEPVNESIVLTAIVKVVKGVTLTELMDDIDGFRATGLFQGKEFNSYADNVTLDSGSLKGGSRRKSSLSRRRSSRNNRKTLKNMSNM